MGPVHRRVLPALTLAFLASVVACATDQGKGEPVEQQSSATSLGTIFGSIVTNGAFTNVYVFPDPSSETWEQHIASLRPSDAASFSRVSIDAVNDRIMATTWPSYFSGLFQYHCPPSTDCGINPPQFFGSGMATQSCVDAALHDANNGVLAWDTVRTLANCHASGMDPSPQVNLIFSPDIRIGAPMQTEICPPHSSTVAWHAWGIAVPNFAAVPTSPACANLFSDFTQSMSHEDVEILTDPAGLGFGDFPTYTSEAADICGTDQQNDPTTVIAPDSLARFWSNTDNDCEPRLDPPYASRSTTWILGEGSPLVRFTGSVHNLQLDVPAARVDTDAVVTQLLVVIQTGGDDLRSDSRADVLLSFNGGSTLTTNISQGENWNNGQTHSEILSFPPGLKVSDITGITIQTNFGGGIGGDNWNVDKVALIPSFAINGSTVTVPPTPIIHRWFEASELPLVRFTGSVHDEILSVPPVDVGDGALGLSLRISVGNDDLRGGSNPGDNADVTIGLASGSSIVLTNVNQGQTWDNWTKHDVDIPIPSGGLVGGDVTSIDIHTNFGGGIGGDNWNVERVELFATIDPATLIKIAITQPTAGTYAHSAMLTLSFTATDDGGPGVGQVVATIDGSTTVGGQTLANGVTIPLLTALSLGSHTFNVVASDVWGNSRSSSVTFQIVVTAASILGDVTQLVASGLIDPQMQTPLLAKLDAAADARARGQCPTAADIYDAFLSQVQAQTGNKIDPAAAAVLIADAQYLIAHCP